MKKLLIVLVMFFLLTGCKNSMKEARAADLRARTRRANDLHQVKMADRRATTQIRLMAIDVGYYALMVSGLVVVVGTGFAITWFVIGGSIGLVQRTQIQRIRLDPVTRQYDAILNGPPGSRRILNPNTGERLLLPENGIAEASRIQQSTRVQVAGLLADHSGIERGWIDEISRN